MDPSGPTNPFATRDPPTPPARKRGRWLRRLGVAVLLLVLTALVSHAWWGRKAAARLSAQLAAVRAAGEPVTVEELNRWPELRGGGGGENIVPRLRAAADAVDQQSEQWVAFAAMEKAVPLNDEEVASAVAQVTKYADVLRRLDGVPRDGAVDWGGGYTSPLLNHIYPPSDLNGMRALAQLLQADALLAHRAGDHARALRRADQVLDLAEAVGHQPQLVPHLVSLGLTALGFSAAAESVPEMRVATEVGEGVPAAQVRALVARLLDDRPLRAGWRRAMVGERVMVVDAVQSMLDGRMSYTHVANPTGAGPATAQSRPWAARPYLLENAAVMAEYDTAVLRATQGAADAPAARAALPQALLDEVKNSKRYLIASIMVPSLERAVNVHYRCIAEKRLVAAALAIKLYEADHDGKPPATLEALVPDYLPSVPRDPFASGGVAIRYVTEADDPKQPRLYSVDEDGNDNGGAEANLDLPVHVSRGKTDLVRHLKRQPRHVPSTRPMVGYPGFYPGMVAPDEDEESPPATQPTTMPSTAPAPAADAEAQAA